MVGLVRRRVRHDLVVDRILTRLRDLVVDVAGEAGEAAEADLKPLVRPVRAFAGATDADPAGDVAVGDRERAERRDDGRDAGAVRGGADAGVGVTVVPHALAVATLPASARAAAATVAMRKRRVFISLMRSAVGAGLVAPSCE